MQAIVIKNGADQQYVTMAEIPFPVLARPEEVVIQVLCVGLDGTDREIITDNYGKLPAGENQMIIGHELLGVVVEAGAASGFIPGDLVTALVRRPCDDESCINCRNGRQDFCVTGNYVERGIFGADGFLCDYVVEDAQYIVKLPNDCIAYGVLVEPQSIVEKVWNQVALIQQRMIWQPKTALVTGSGPLGILAALTCRVLGIDTYVWSKSDAQSINAEIILRSGSHYKQAEGVGSEVAGDDFFTGLTNYAAQLHTGFDMIWECSGHVPLGYEALALLNPNGVLAMLSVTAGNNWLHIPCDLLNQEIVMKNKCIIGSVNASRQDFETGIDRLRAIEGHFPDILSALLSERFSLEAVPEIDFASIKIKAIVDLVLPAQWDSCLQESKDSKHVK